MRAKGEKIHTFLDRLMRADFVRLSDEHLKIALRADSLNSADKTCDVQGIYGLTRIRIGAVVYILQHYPEQALENLNEMEEMDRLGKIICSLPTAERNAVVEKLRKNRREKEINQQTAPSQRDNAEEDEVE